MSEGKTPATESPTRAWKREYLRGYYRQHRSYKRLSGPELEVIRGKPVLCREIRDDAIVCLEEGLLMARLRFHLEREHGLTCRAFREKWRLPKSFPLCSKAFSRAMEKERGAALVAAGTATRFKKAGDEPVLSRGRTEQHGSRRSWQPRESVVADWDIARARLRGKRLGEIANKFKLTTGAISARLLRMGFPKGHKTTGLVLFHGELLSRRHLPLLVRDWMAVKHAPVPALLAKQPSRHEQFTVEEAAGRLSVPLNWVRERTRARAALRVGARRGKKVYLGNSQLEFLAGELARIRRKRLEAKARAEVAQALGFAEADKTRGAWIVNRLRAKDEGMPLSEKAAERIAVLWRALKGEWQTKAAGSSGGRPKKLLPSEEAALPGRYRRLLVDLKDLLRWLRDKDGRTTKRALMEHVCAEAKRGSLRTLLFCPEFFRWLDSGFDRDTGAGMDWPTFLLGRPRRSEGDWRPNEVAIEFLAHDYGVAPRTLRNALSVPRPPAVLEKVT